MATKLINDFQEYELTPEEQIISQCFNDLQEMYLRNELANCIRSKLDISPLLDHHTSSLLHAELKGKIDMLKGLLSVSEDTRKDVMDRNLENARSN